MRVMVIVKASKESEAGQLPSEKELTEMGEFNEELVKAGIMLAGEGLKASSTGARVRFDKSGKKTVTDGPFAETKEQLGGFFLIEARDLDEACAIAAKFPPARVATLEVRPVQELRHSRDQRGLPR